MDSLKSIASDNNFTQYASPQRIEPSDIYRQRKLLTEYYLHISDCFEAVSEIILIVNENRQIVFFNQHAPQFLKSDPEALFGKRPGEALDCMYGCKNPAGCGTSKFCSECGAVNAILNSLSDKKRCPRMQDSADRRQSLRPAHKNNAAQYQKRKIQHRCHYRHQQ